jgi:hypothetical protein
MSVASLTPSRIATMTSRSTTISFSVFDRVVAAAELGMSDGNRIKKGFQLG